MPQMVVKNNIKFGNNCPISKKAHSFLNFRLEKRQN